MIKKHNEKTSEGGFELGLGGILKGLGDMVEKLGDLAKTGEQISQTGEIHGSGKDVKGIYGFTVKVGLGDDKPRVEPFGNIRQDRESGHTVVQEVREPVVDVFEEDGSRTGGGRDAGRQRGRRANHGGGRPADHLRRARRQEVSQGGAAAGELYSREDAGHLQQRRG